MNTGHPAPSPEGRHAAPPPDLPGADLVAAGLADLAAGRETVAAMLVATASIRLRRLGYAVPQVTTDQPEGRLYDLLEAEVGHARAHGRYNALRRRLSSFLRSAPAPGPAHQ